MHEPLPQQGQEQTQEREQGPTAGDPPQSAARCTLRHDVIAGLRGGSHLVFLRPVIAASFPASAETFAVLAGLSLLLLFMLGFASVGFAGEFNGFEVPRALLNYRTGTGRGTPG